MSNGHFWYYKSKLNSFSSPQLHFPQSSFLRKTHVSLLASQTWNPSVIFKASPLFIPHIHSITNPPNSLSSKEIQSLGTPCHLYCASPAQATSFFTWIKELPNCGPCFCHHQSWLDSQPCILDTPMRESKSAYDGLQGSTQLHLYHPSVASYHPPPASLTCLLLALLFTSHTPA